MAGEQAFLSQPSAFAGGRIIASPFQFVADADTFLRVVSVCSASGVVVALQGRRLDERQQLQAIQETHAPLSTRTTQTQDYQLGPGAILNLTVFALSGTPIAGQCYVMVQLLRNFGGTAIVLGTLLGGYVTATQALGFPGSPVVSSLEGEPALRVVNGTLPPAGQECLEAVPTGARWEVVYWLLQLQTSAAVILRNVRLFFVNPGVNFHAIFCMTIGQNANQNKNYCFTNGTIESEDNPQTSVTVGICTRPLLPAPLDMQTSTYNIQPGDQFLVNAYVVREWLEVR